MRGSKVLVTTLFVSILSIVTLHAQIDAPVYKGRFTLAQPIQWNTTILQPGDYTITIGFTGSPVFAFDQHRIRSSGRTSEELEPERKKHQR